MKSIKLFFFILTFLDIGIPPIFFTENFDFQKFEDGKKILFTVLDKSSSQAPFEFGLKAIGSMKL